MKIPQVTFRTRIGDNQSLGGGCAIGGEWKDIISSDLFKDKKIILFSLPGAYTPTYSSYLSSYPGTCCEEQVGVYAPGNENRTIFLSLNKSLEVMSFHSPPMAQPPPNDWLSPILVLNVTCGIFILLNYSSFFCLIYKYK